jgi:hypothetical protein
MELGGINVGVFSLPKLTSDDDQTNDQSHEQNHCRSRSRHLVFEDRLSLSQLSGTVLCQ